MLRTRLAAIILLGLIGVPALGLGSYWRALLLLFVELAGCRTWGKNVNLFSYLSADIFAPELCGRCFCASDGDSAPRTVSCTSDGASRARRLYYIC